MAGGAEKKSVKFLEKMKQILQKGLHFLNSHGILFGRYKKEFKNAI